MSMTWKQYNEVKERIEEIKDMVFRNNWNSDSIKKATNQLDIIINNLEDQYGYGDKYVAAIREYVKYYRKN